MPNDECLASIIVCTRNRAASLKQTLASITSQQPVDGACEIIIIDNDSRDGTVAIVQAFQRHSHLSTRYLLETRKGLSVSRNRGIKAAQGRFLVFIDDDARASSQWLAQIVRGFNSHPDVDAIGGPVLPYPPVIPAWLPRRLRSHLSLVDYGPNARMLVYPYFPIGTNMAIRKKVFDHLGYFDATLGRHGSNSQSTGEETDFFLRLQRTGRQIYYAPRAIVFHQMHPERLQPRWLYRQAFWIGHSSAVMEIKSWPLPAVYLNLLRSSLLIAIDAVIWSLAGLLQDQKLKVWSCCILNNAFGYIRGICKSVYNDKKREIY